MHVNDLSLYPNQNASLNFFGDYIEIDKVELKEVQPGVVYFDNPAGVGDHPNIIEELDKQVSIIASAEDKLQALNKHFNNTQI